MKLRLEIRNKLNAKLQAICSPLDKVTCINLCVRTNCTKYPGIKSDKNSITSLSINKVDGRSNSRDNTTNIKTVPIAENKRIVLI
jgi:hypothetical protein